MDSDGGMKGGGVEDHGMDGERRKGRQGGRGIDFPLRILVSSEMVGAIIGRGGATIRNITQDSRARVDVHSRRKVDNGPGPLPAANQMEKAITVYGQPENCTAACKRILEVMEEEAKNVGKEQEICLKMLAHNNLIGRIIGKQGAIIKKIMEDTNTNITVSSISDISSFNLERVISIRGTIEDISKAESEVSTKLRAAYESDLQAMAPQSLMFPGLHPAAMMSTIGLSNNYRGGGPNTNGGNPQQQAPPANRQQAPHAPPPVQTESSYLYIPNAAVGAVIGTKGSHIRNIIKFSGSTVNIAPAEEETGVMVPVYEGATQEARRKVTVTGNPEAQWKAQYLVYEKLREEGFSGAVEDVKLTVEIRVPSSQVGRIIGKGGANVREMQRLTQAVIKLPEQGSTVGEETSVFIIGTFYATQSAQRRLRAMVSSPMAPPHHLQNGGGNSIDTAALTLAAQKLEI